MPGGGFGQFDGCTKEWAATSDIWGDRYGGYTTNTCSKFPSALEPGCSFRWGWFQGTDNPNVDYEVVTCPAEIVAKSGCSRNGESAHLAPRPHLRLLLQLLIARIQDRARVDLHLERHLHLSPLARHLPYQPFPPSLPLLVTLDVPDYMALLALAVHLVPTAPSHTP